MLTLNPVLTERTTAATDLLLAVVCLAVLPPLLRLHATDAWKATLWVAVFALLALASMLGTVVHAFALPARVSAALWQPLYLVLGLVIALFVVAAVRDWLGQPAAERLLVPALLVGVAFWVATRVLDARFIVFVVYDVAAMLIVLAIYVVLARRGVPGAGTIALGVAVNLIANALQASSLRVNIVWPFDHNSLFHVVEIVAVILLQHGVRVMMVMSS